MSNAVKAVIGIVLIAVGVITYNPEVASWGATLAFNVGAALLLNAAASLFIKAPRGVPLSGISINYSGTLEPRRIIYGTMKMGGRNVIPPS